MRSTNEICIAVQECTPCTDEELRLCIMSLSAMLYFAKDAADKMAEMIVKDQPAKKFMANCWINDRERRFQAMKMPVDKYLGASNTPGTKEYEARLSLGKTIFKKATSIDL